MEYQVFSKEASKMSKEDLESKLRAEIVSYGKKMVKLGLVFGSEGNISVRLPSKGYLITPSMVDYEEMRKEDIVLVDGEGSVLSGDKKPSIETPIHLAVYKARKDVNAVIHSHPTFSTVVAILGLKIPPIVEEMIPFLGGELVTSEYGIPGSEELANNVVKALGNKNAVFIANHGLLACGSSLKDALRNTMLAERIARVFVLSSLLGKPRELPEDSIEFQLDLYRKLHKMKE